MGQYSQHEIAERIGGVAPLPDADKGYILPEAKPVQTETHSPQGHRYLMRTSDGCIYGWNPRLAWNPNFKPIHELPREYIQRNAAAKAERERIVVGFQAQKAAQAERAAALKAAAAARIRAARGLQVEIDTAAAEKAQLEAEEAFLMKADARQLAIFAFEKYGARLPIGDMHLMRDVVLQLWDGTITEWEVGEPKDWRSKECLATFLRDKFFVVVSAADIRAEDARAQVRALLDGYAEQHPGVGQANAA